MSSLAMARNNWHLRPLIRRLHGGERPFVGCCSRRAPESAGFDGLWIVAIVTLQGSCDRSYRYPVRIEGNRVLQAGADPSYRLYGAVSRSGAIRVIVVRGDQWADGSGRLTDGRGAGNWTASAGQCAGQWTAVRRG
jgi:hypothetical protein